MTPTEDAVYLFLVASLTVACAACVWLCFRRTRISGFLFLGAVLILWPLFDSGTELLRRHSMAQVMQGGKPGPFPFSLMVRGDEGWSGWQMPPGEFLTKFSAAKEILHVLLLITAFTLIARAAKGLRADHAEHDPK